MRGIVLAGGTGSRLWPLTRAVSKQLMPVFDKPMIYYPMSTLVAAGIRDILVITTPAEVGQFQRLLGNGYQWGLNIAYATQSAPRGIAEALIIGDESGYIGDDGVALILGDNIFHGPGLVPDAWVGAQIFAYPVANPSDYGVVYFTPSGTVFSIEEKPTVPKSRYAVTGLYFYDSDVANVARSITPSARGELEITAVNEIYRKRGELRVTALEPGSAWLDTGTFDSLVAASEYVRVIEQRQGRKVGCIEETAWRQGFIDDFQLAALASPLMASGYGQYLLDLLDA